MMRMLGIVVLLTGCRIIEAGKYAPSLYSSDSTAITDSGSPPETDPCEEAPLVNWNNFGESFMTEACTGCHHPEAPDRYGAPEGIDFDTLESVWSYSVNVLIVAGGADPSMPPQGGTTEMDRQLLEFWLNCAQEGT